MKEISMGLIYGLGWGLGLVGIVAAAFYLVPGLGEAVVGALTSCFA